MVNSIISKLFTQKSSAGLHLTVLVLLQDETELTLFVLDNSELLSSAYWTVDASDGRDNNRFNKPLRNHKKNVEVSSESLVLPQKENTCLVEKKWSSLNYIVTNGW